ncbi:MAG TPA: acyltransferase domain-containing protein [Polyangiaceae bacterium]
MSDHLDPNQIRRNAAEAGLGVPAQDALIRAAADIEADAGLRQAAELAHHVLFHTDEDWSEVLSAATVRLGALASAWNALMLLDSTRLVRERQGARGIPANITRAINERHGFAWLRRAERDGRCTLDDWLPNWFRFVASGSLYRLGRLEFAPLRWSPPFRAYRHDPTGHVVLLANPGARFSDDGHRVGELTWTASLEEGTNHVVGHPVHPRGVVLSRPIRLELPAWRAALTESHVVLDLHIPPEGALSLPLLRDSMEQAASFFDAFHPVPRFAAYTCESWLFSDQLENFLGAGSNIVRWQKQGYLFPSALAERWFFEFTFGAASIDPATAPTDTRLRRGVVELLRRGERPRSGGYLLFREDLSRFGARPYGDEISALTA